MLGALPVSALMRIRLQQRYLPTSKISTGKVKGKCGENSAIQSDLHFGWPTDQKAYMITNFELFLKLLICHGIGLQKLIFMKLKLTAVGSKKKISRNYSTD